MRKILAIGVGAMVFGALAVGGVSVASAGEPANRAAASTMTAPKVDAAAARQIALHAVPGGRILEIEADDLADRPVWKVTLTTQAGRSIVYVDAVTGAATVRPAGTTADGDRGGNRAPGADDAPGHDAGDAPGHEVGDDRGRGRGGDDGAAHR